MLKQLYCASYSIAKIWNMSKDLKYLGYLNWKCLVIKYFDIENIIQRHNSFKASHLLVVSTLFHHPVPYHHLTDASLRDEMMLRSILVMHQRGPGREPGQARQSIDSPAPLLLVTASRAQYHQNPSSLAMARSEQPLLFSFSAVFFSLCSFFP